MCFNAFDEYNTFFETGRATLKPVPFCCGVSVQRSRMNFAIISLLKGEFKLYKSLAGLRWKRSNGQVKQWKGDAMERRRNGKVKQWKGEAMEKN